MIEKFDQNKKNLLISVFISILIIFFNLEIENVDFFEKISIPKKLEIYFILIVNSYFYYEIITSWLLLELEKELNKKVYKIHFIISTIAYSSVVLIVLAKSIKIDITINYLIFTIISSIIINCLYSIFFNIRKIIISIHYNLNESIINVVVLLINLALIILLLFQFNISYLKNLNYIHYIILFITLLCLSYAYINFIIATKYFTNYKDFLWYFTTFKAISPILKKKSANKSTEDIQKEIKESSKNTKLDQNTPLEDKIATYITSGDIDSVVQIINKNKGINLNFRRPNGWTFLHYSVAQGEYEITKFLLENSCETDISNQMGLYPINFAINYNNIKILSLLIEFHANIEIKDRFGFPPIYSAIKNNNLEIIKLLIKNGAKFKQKNNDLSPLEFAKKERKGNIAKYLKNISK